MKVITPVLVLTSALLLMSSPILAQDTYIQFGGLNVGYADVGESWTKLETGTHSFETSQESNIEVHLNARFTIGTLSAFGVQFEVRRDDVVVPHYSNRGYIWEPETAGFLPIFAVFLDVPAGTHTMSIWARALQGTASRVIADTGGVGGKMILKFTGGSAVAVAPDPPAGTAVRQNYPNPFNPGTTIEYAVRQPGQIEVRIYDTAGRQIRTLVDAHRSRGEHTVVWDGRDDAGRAVPSGTYLYQVKTRGATSTKKMILLK